MEVEKKPKFKFSTEVKSHHHTKDKENKLKEKENFTIDELKQYYNIFMVEYKSKC